MFRQSCSRVPAMAWLGVGLAFIAISRLPGLLPLLGTGLAFLGLAIGSMIRARQGR